MSGSSSVEQCPSCGGKKFQVYYDWKPYDMTDAYCLDCGFGYETQEKHLSLEEVNYIREDYDLPPIKELLKGEL